MKPASRNLKHLGLGRVPAIENLERLTANSWTGLMRPSKSSIGSWGARPKEGALSFQGHEDIVDMSFK